MATNNDKETTESSMTRRIITNILDWCIELKQTARDYTQLGSREQAKVWNDLTGDEGRRRRFGTDGKEYFTNDDYEPPEFVEDTLLELAEEIDKLPSNKKGALESVIQKYPEYVNRSFRIKFLRAEKFDASLAAIRMALHFEEKLTLFGEEKLGRDILLSDLDEDDMACLKTGYLQVLSDLDFGNRKVLFYYKACSDCYKERENLLRAFWYVTNTLSGSEDVQKLGVVNVVYNLCGLPKEGIDWEKSRRLAGLFKAVPLRMCSFYPCSDTRAWGVVVEGFSVIVPGYLRIRMRVIKGDHEDVILKLKAVGVPADVLPVTEDGELLIEGHLQWIRERNDKEESDEVHSNKRPRAERAIKSNLCYESLSIPVLPPASLKNVASGLPGSAYTVG